ncbi:hypothetical protein AVEN_123166-1 [Araneus ventricosus]|uniref:Uncharacterized protein n=1 Tax=Araneus ventricosus TaxID=182803 RepID=A0A4Y2JTM8_ARAVE|nr:hypothetical protein AVEN_123166-1 [Araneus ventricosus]
MSSTRATVKRSKEKEHKQQHISVTEIVLMTSFRLVKSYRSCSKFQPEAVIQASQRCRMEFLTFWKIPVISRISPAANEMRAKPSSIESKGSRTPMSSYDPSKSPGMIGPAIWQGTEPDHNDISIAFQM